MKIVILDGATDFKKQTRQARIVKRVRRVFFYDVTGIICKHGSNCTGKVDLNPFTSRKRSIFTAISTLQYYMQQISGIM